MRRAEPGPGPESVWDYPRPPAVEPSGETVVVSVGGTQVARSTRALRVLETSHPPVYYLPVDDVLPGVLRPSAARSTWCEFKGAAAYVDVVVGHEVVAAAGWTYADPSPGYEALRDHVAFYPGRVEATVDGEAVLPQAGGFYGGWVTSRVTGPFKGGPGTRGW